MSISCGIFLYGRVFKIPLPRSFIRRILRSISGTCSFAAVVFITMIGTRFCRHSNSLSMRIVPTWKPPRAYRSIIRVIPAARFFLVQEGVYSAVNRFNPREALTRNGTPFTNIQSTLSVTIRCRSKIVAGICTYLIRTDSGACRTVLPLTPARSGPKIVLAFLTAVSVTLQLLIIFARTIPRNSRSVGCPNIPCASRASFASSISRFVKPSMFDPTVSIVPWMRHSASSASSSRRSRKGIPRELLRTTMLPSLV